jgi:hypothetical protein
MDSASVGIVVHTVVVFPFNPGEWFLHEGYALCLRKMALVALNDGDF